MLESGKTAKTTVTIVTTRQSLCFYRIRVTVVGELQEGMEVEVQKAPVSE